MEQNMKSILARNLNTGGVTLTVFELVTATFAADGFSLRDDWERRESRLHDHKQLENVEATEYLTATALLDSYRRHREKGSAVSCKRRDVLNLSVQAYKDCANHVEEGYGRAVRFLTRERIFDSRNLPYQTQLIPLSVICAELGDEFEVDSVRQKLARWYWCGVFGELYGGANETRFALDVPDVLRWIQSGGEEPRTVRDSGFSPTRLLSLQTRNSAAYKGLFSLLMQKGSLDFINGDPIELTAFSHLNIDVHHIFPRSYCEKSGFPRQKWNSVINKAPLSSRSNHILGGNAPSIYLGSIERNQGISTDRMNEILESHLISPALLRTDQFDAFIIMRAVALLDLIEQATGRSIYGRDSEEVVDAFGESLARK